MTELDRIESNIIFDVYDKIQNRANAKLTKEEKAVMEKYNIERWEKSLYVNGFCILNKYFIMQERFNCHYDYSLKKYVKGYNIRNVVNIADRARKAKEREYSHSINYVYRKNFLEEERKHINYKYYADRISANNAVKNIRFYQK